MLSCYSHGDSKSAVGVVQQMVVAAPLGRMQEIMDNIEGFQEIFPDFNKIQILEVTYVGSREDAPY